MHFLNVFWLFIKVNLLTTSGPASVGLLYDLTVPSLLTEAQFVEAVGYSSALPGSDALQLAVFVGHAIGGVSGALAALLGSILPPALFMVLIVAVLQWLRGEAWVTLFVRGLTPAVAVLMLITAFNIFRGENTRLGFSMAIGAGSLVALLMKVPSPVVLLAAGLLGIGFAR
jgi:chromate transporter